MRRALTMISFFKASVILPISSLVCWEGAGFVARNVFGSNVICGCFILFALNHKDKTDYLLTKELITNTPKDPYLFL